MARWDLNLIPKYTENEPDFLGGFSNSLVAELERQRQKRELERQEAARLAMTPGVTMEKPENVYSPAPGVRVKLPDGIQPKALPIPLPKPTFDHATGRLTQGAPAPTVDPNQSPLEQSLQALAPVYNEIPLASGKTAYFDPNYARRGELQEKVITGQQSRWETQQANETARARARQEYEGLLAANPPTTRLGQRLRSVTPDMWANNPTLRDDIIKQGNQATPEETWNQQQELQAQRDRDMMARLAATLAANRQNTTIRIEAQKDIAGAGNDTRIRVAEIGAQARASSDSTRAVVAREKGSKKTGGRGIAASRVGGQSGSSGPVNPRRYIQDVAREPAFKGAADIAIKAEAVRRRVNEIMRASPNLSDAELEAQLRAEGFPLE